MRWELVRRLTLKATDLSNILIHKRNWKYGMEDFKNMPKNSLGNGLYIYLKRKKISFKPNLIRHDIKHILLGYEMDMLDELRIHSFLMGNRSFNALGMVYFIICTSIIPETIPQLIKPYKSSQRALS